MDPMTYDEAIQVISDYAGSTYTPEPGISEAATIATAEWVQAEAAGEVDYGDYDDDE